MHLAFPKELLVQCALVLTACVWLGSDAAGATTVVLPTTTYRESGTVTETAATAAVPSTTSATTETTPGAVSTQGSTARPPPTTASASTASAVSDATAGTVTETATTATVSSTTSATSETTPGAVSTQGSTATAPPTTASASTASAVSDATAGTVTETAATATVSSTTSVTTETTPGAVSTQGSTARPPPTTASASTTSAVSDATAALDADCNDAVCLRPHCACASDEPPAGLRPDQMPQFVTLTFDDAVTVANMAFYRELLEGFARKNKASGCGIAATFFVSHEYTDYAAVNELHSWGNEIAMHSISHRTDWDYWHTINSTQWERELLDQKIMMQTFANVSASEVVGVRGPFLYTGGDQLFRMQAQHFRYDCTLVHQRVRRGSENPVYPYTMDFGFRRSCMVYPCPKDAYPGLWVMPMNVLFREHEGQELPCAMADACLPQPTTANDTFEYLRSNFEDFYTTNRAPFPLFLHEAYLRDPGRKQGYLQFIDWLLQKEDVYLVTISEVLRFMQDPKPLGAYVQHTCPGSSPIARSTSCPKPRSCAYKNTSLGGDRYMKSCSRCPKNYPWVGNPMGN